MAKRTVTRHPKPTEKEVADFTKFAANFSRFTQDQLNEVELYILKCHLIIEHELTSYIEDCAMNRLSLESTGFMFDAKMKIAKLFGAFDGQQGEKMELFCKLLNKIRNQISHKFDYDESAMKNLLDAIQNFLPNKFGKEVAEQPSKTMFAYALPYVAGILGGRKRQYREIYTKGLKAVQKPTRNKK